MNIKYITDKVLKEYKGKTCVLRIDLNIDPFEEDNHFRIKAVIPTINLLIKNNIKIVILSHRGRPKIEGLEPNKEGLEELSLGAVAPLIAKYAKQDIDFISAYRLGGCKKAIKESDAQIILLENLRFFEGEKTNDPAFAKKLAEIADFYINDAFAVCHRKSASTVGIVEELPSYGGIQLKNEVDNLSKVMERYESPLTVIIGGVKTGDKTGVMDNFWNKADNFIFGGGAANTFLKAKGIDIKQSIFDKSSVNNLKKYLDSDKVILPNDFKEEDNMFLDIGETSEKEFERIIKKSKTIIWNGPMGMFEKEEFAKGSYSVANSIIESGAFSVVGGGETVSVITKINLIDKFDFVSTGGGAMLEFLAGKELPGIEALR